MNIEEFLVKADAENESNTQLPVEQISSEEQPAEIVSQELDVQKAVVESLAAEKVEQDEHISQLTAKIKSLESELEGVKGELKKAIDQIDVNHESPLSNQVALLDREETLTEKFTGEFRDQVIEVLREARDEAEKEGRLRRAQILEAVLVANQSSGELDKKRKEVEKLFTENQNIINGTVIETLKKLGISHKNGEEYLLVPEIIKRNF